MSTLGAGPGRPEGLRRRVRYRFDNVLARGMWATLVWLGVVTLVVMIVSSLLLVLFDVTLAGSDERSWSEDLWQTMLRTLDPGTMASDVGWGRRFLALAVTLFGILVAGTLIGIIASGVEARIARMQRGRSAVVESDHLVVLGGSERLAVLIEQLVLANAGRGGATIVVLSGRDPSELNEEVRAAVRNLRGSRLVIRAGDPTSRVDLGLVRLDRARAAIVLADVGGDAAAVKSVLAIGAELGSFDRLRIVVELANPVIGQRLVDACGREVHPMATTQAVARTAAFALRQPALGQIIDELLDFAGCDLHIGHRPEVVGMTFGSIVQHYANAKPIGRVRIDGVIDLAPSPDIELEPEDQLILIADDLESLEEMPSKSRREPLHQTSLPAVDPVGPISQHLLVVGWNDFGAELLGNWASFATPDSTVDIVVDPSLCDIESVSVPELTPGSVTVMTAASPPATVPERTTTIVMLGYSDRLTAAAADVRTLLDLMVLRQLVAANGRMPPHFTVELLDSGNRSLAEFGPDDYVISQAIGSQFLAQLAEQPGRRDVLLTLYASDGPSIRLITADQLGLAGEFTTADLMAVSYRAGYLAIGWRRRTVTGYDLVLNPRYDHVAELDRDDQIVVIG